MALTDGLVSYWPFNETSGNALDAHGSKTLTDGNTVGYDTGKVYTNARKFVAANSEYFERDADDTLGGGWDMTICGWFYLSSQAPESPDYYLIIDNTYAYLGYDLLLVDNGTLQFVFRSFNGDTTPNAQHHNVVADGYHGVGEWHFFVCWYDHSEKRIYAAADDHSADSMVCTDAMTNQWYDVFDVGRYSSSGGVNYFDGRLQSICFWNRIITSDERSSMYNNGNGRTYAAMSFVFMPQANGLLSRQAVKRAAIY